MDRIIEKLLTHDPVADTESLLGDKHWSEFTEDEQLFCLARSMSYNAFKNKHLQSIGDTYFGMSWKDFKKLLMARSFKIGFTNELSYNYNDHIGIEEEIIYYQPDKGMIVYATSFSDQRTINGGTLYAEIQARDADTKTKETIWKWLSTGGLINKEDLIYETSHDVREGLFSKLEILESTGTFLKKWTNKDRFLWFVNYIESKNKPYDSKMITQSKIERCPQELREIIGR